MQQSEWIEEYLEKAVPKTVSGKKYADIRDELMSHIADKTDFYIEYAILICYNMNGKTH